MPTYQVDVGDKTYEVDAPDPNTAWQWANYTHTQPAAPVKPAGFSLKNIGTAFGQGALGSAEALTNVAGAGNAASQYLSGVSKSLGEQYTPERQAEMQRQQERMKKAEQSGSTWEEIKAGVQNIAEAPIESVAQGLGSFVPYLPAMFAGPVAAALGLSSRAVAAANVAAKAYTPVVGTAQGAGAVKGAIYDAVYKAEIEDKVPEAEARQKAEAAQDYAGKNLDQIALGGVAGLAAARGGIEKFLTKEGREKAGEKLLPRVGRAMAEESVTEGAQGGQERLASNLALQRTGRDVPTFQGVAGQAAQEGIIGGLTAGPVSAIGGRGPKPEVTPEAPPKVTPETTTEATDELEQLSPEQRRILAQQRAVTEKPKDALSEVQKQIQTGQPTTMDDVARIKDEHETAIIEGLLNQDAEMKLANDLAQAQLQQQQDQARTQLQDQSAQETLNNAIAGTDARVREGRLLSRVQDLIENNIPFASTAINDINSKFQLIKEAPLTEQERARVQSIMGMAQAFTNFVNLPQLPPKAVDRFAENQQMEQQIKERKERGQLPAQPIRTETPAPSPVIQKDAIGKGIDEGTTPRPPSGIEPSTAEDSQLGLGRSQTFGIAPPTEVAPVTEPVVTETKAPEAVEEPPIEEGPMPKSIDQIETEEKIKPVVESAQQAIAELTKKPANLFRYLIGRLTPSEASDISPEKKFRLLRQSAKKGKGTDLSTIVQSGALDDFLPPDMRVTLKNPDEIYDETDAVGYIKDKLRNDNPYTFDTEIALKQAFESIEEAENLVEEFIRIEDANELLAEAAAEQRAIDKEAEVITPEGEDRTAQESVQEGLTAPTPEELKAADERAKAKEKRIADEKKAVDDKAKADAEVGGFTLTGSDRPADVAAAAGQKPMFSLRGKSEGQVTAFEQSLRTLLNKFGLKDIGLKLSEGMRDEGSYAAKLIQIAADSANPIRTLRHEAIHALRELGFFTDAQWKSLSKMAKDKWIDQYLKQRNIDGKPLKAGEESRYDAYMREYKGDMEKITEEAVADAFADFDTKPPAGMIQAIIQRLRNLFQSIRSALTKMESAEQIFGKVEKGALKPEAERTTTESKSLRDRATANFKRWFGDSKVVDKNGEPLVVYHGTDKAFNKVNMKKGSQGVFWVTSDRSAIEKGEVGAAGSGAVMELYARIKNPAGWKEYDQMSLGELEGRGYDGVILPDPNGSFVAIVFDPNQIKSATGNNGDYSLTNADIRKSLRTTTGGEAAMETLKRMGREVKPPEDGYVKKTKQAWNNAVDNPQTTAQAVKDTLVRWGDQVQTWAFSSDAALNNNLKRAIMDSAKTDPEKTAFLLNTSLSQTVHADALASLFITEGNIRYNKELLKWEAVKDKDNLVSLVKGLEDIAKKYNLTKEEAQLIGHTAFEAKRLKSLVAFNESVKQEVKDMRSEAAKLRKEGKSKAADSLYEKAAKRSKETKFIHMTDEQIADGNALFKNIPELDNLVKTWNGIRTNATKVLIDTGLWSEADADFLLSNADYVPFFREDQLENGKGPKEFIRGLQVQAQEKKLKGSNKPVNDIFDNMVRWTQYSINRGVRNRSAVALAEGAAEMGMARKVPVRAGNENVVRVWKNGEEVLYSMADPMFIPAFTGLESIALPSWKILSKFSNILRQSVVMYPLFSISQVPQDAFAAMFTSGLKPQYALRIPVLAVKEFVKTLASKSKTHEELKMFGVTGVRDFTADMARVDAEVLAGLKAEPGILNAIKGKLHHIAMASDNAVRQATYEAAMAQGMSQKEALEKSFEIWNIRRKGSSSTLAIAGQVIPFFNAYLAAQNVMVKVITGQGTSPTKKAEAYKTLAATTASVMTLSLLYTMMNGDDEDYLDKPAAQRDRLLMIPGSGGMSIPLRKDLYTMPKIITEHTYLLMTDKGYEDGRKFRDSMKAALASTFFSPTAVPQALKPLIEVGINYDFFTGRPIIGQFQKKLEVERQFNDTTAELAKVFGSTGLVSPLNAEHLIRGMFGSVGGLVLYATNPILHSDPNVERPTLSAREMLATLPGTSGFISREDQTGLKNDFYVLRDEVAKVASTISDMKARSPEKLEDYLSSEDVIAKYGMSKAVNKMVEQLGKIRKQITQITNLPSDVMTGEEKQDQIKELKALEKDMLKSINVKELRAAANL
jgi:hypothetical protein